MLALTRNPVMRLFAEPVDVLSPGGYATWRLSMLLPMLAIWALLAVSRTLRGEEESGALDLLLSVPRSRRRVVLEKLAAIATALVLIGVLIACARVRGRPRDSSRARAASRVAVRAQHDAVRARVRRARACRFAVHAREASGRRRDRHPAGASFVLTSAGRAVPGGAWIGRLSPLYYFELNKPLVTGYAVNVGALL